MTGEEYSKLMWWDCLDQLDPIRCAAYVPNRLRPTWDEVIRFKLLQENAA